MPALIYKRGIAPLLVIFLFMAGVSPVYAEKIKILVVGDSLSAGYGVGPGESFPVQLEAALRKQNKDVDVINAGVSGDTSSGGLARLEWVIDSALPDLVVLELGANDALRGIDPALTRQNMDQMLKILKKRNIPVLLAGMLAPPNLGEIYGKKFNSLYPDLAKKYGSFFYPFFLDGVAGVTKLNQADGMHPTKTGVAVIVSRIMPQVLKAIFPLSQ